MFFYNEFQSNKHGLGRGLCKMCGVRKSSGKLKYVDWLRFLERSLHLGGERIFYKKNTLNIFKLNV